MLKAQALALQTQLQDLQGELAGLQRDADLERAAQLLEANQHLVLAALHAETVAEAAVSGFDELSYASQRDGLTGLSNRATMRDRLDGALAMARRRRAPIAVLFLDIDNFKRINDTLGHAVGDEVLQLVAQRLEGVLRHSDTVSRHGGDEFLVLLTEVAHASDAAAIATKMIGAIAEPAHLVGHVLNLTASIGVAIFPDDGADASVLISRADAAMYRAKRGGGGRFELHLESR